MYEHALYQQHNLALHLICILGSLQLDSRKSFGAAPVSATLLHTNQSRNTSIKILMVARKMGGVYLINPLNSELAKKGLEANLHETFLLVLQRSNVINSCSWARESTKHCAC